MIRFGLRLSLASGREALGRLVIIAAAVALGVGLLLATLAGVNATNAQFGRTAWMNPAPPSAGAAAPAGDPLWWADRRDYFDGRAIDRFDIAATGPNSPVPPGIPRLPGPGEFYASPELGGLLTSTPANQLADRFAGHQVGTIGPAALFSPKSLIVIVGHTPDQVSHLPRARQVTSIDTSGFALPIAAVDLVLSVVAGGLLFPVLIFIGTATRLTAARREQRFAAMRLVGATPRQISVIAAVEATAAAIAGTAAGFGLFFLFRDALAGIPFTGQPFFPDDLSLGVLGVLLVALGVPAGAALAARLALRRVRISPLGVTRSVTPRPPRAYRLIPLVLGIVELAFFIGRVPESSNAQVAAFLPGFLLVMVGLMLAGPWLTMVGARLLARRSSRPATLIAARRLADNPQGGFRAISGVVLALFVTSVAVGVITTIVANRGTQHNAITESTLTQQFGPDSDADPDAATAELRAVPGVRSITVVHRNPVNTEDSLAGVVSCADLAKTTNYGRCPDGAAVVEVWSDLLGARAKEQPAKVWPVSAVPVEQLAQLPAESVVAGTDGSTAALERARTTLERTYPDYEIAPATPNDFGSEVTNQLTGFQQLANVVILASLPIAGCSLAVSVIGGLTDRKRPFSLLRLTGVQLGVLRRVVALESVVPLLAASALAIAAGFLSAQLFLKAQMEYTLAAPGTAYYVTVVAGLIASLGIIAATMPLLRRITGPETARNE